MEFPFRDSSSEINGSSETSRKSSDEWSSTQNYLEEEPDRSTIKQLPESIEEIYIQAIEAKKKITKKNTKKKDKKEHRILKKEIEFVPREQDINYLLQLKNNLKWLCEYCLWFILITHGRLSFWVVLGLLLFFM